MRIPYLLLFILLAGLAGLYKPLLAQNLLTAADTLTGEWTGKYTFRGQAPYRLTIQLKQTGQAITGKQQQNLAGGAWARCKVAGKRMGDSVDFSEVYVLENHNPDYENLYCLYRVRGTVRRDGNDREMHGRATPTGMQYEHDGHIRAEECLKEPTGNFSARMPAPKTLAVVLTGDTVRQTRPLEALPARDSTPAPPLPEKPVAARRPVAVKAPTRLVKTKVLTVHAFQAAGDAVLVEYRDNLTIDGDVVSLNLDGDAWLVRHSALKRGYKKAGFRLQNDDHYLILYAENGGNGGKNTATIRLTSGGVSQTFDMTSDGGTSQAIRIKRKH